MSLLASWYNFVNEAEYAPYAAFLDGVISSRAKIRVKEVLDLGCGTGGITARMADMGYDMLGIDISTEMLSRAERRGSVLYVCGDMRSFELYGTVQAAYSSYDCFNCLDSASDVERAFRRVALFLEKGGVFVFDVNTKYRADKVYDGKCYCFERGDDMLVWQSQKKSGNRIDFYLTEFTRESGGYARRDECLTQRIWSVKTLIKLLSQTGFAVTGVYGSRELTPLESTSEKAYFIAERI